MATVNEIKSNAQLVKNATEIGENTAPRVGGVLVDMADHLPETIEQATGTSTTSVMSQKAVTDELAKKANQSDVEDALAGKVDNADIMQELGDSENAVMSQKAVTDAILNKIDLSAIDFDSDTLVKLALCQAPTRFNVVKNNKSCGTMEVFSDDMGHMVTEVFDTHYTLVDGELGTAHLDDKIFRYMRSYHISGGTSDIPVGTWGEWKQVCASDDIQNLYERKVNLGTQDPETVPIPQTVTADTATKSLQDWDGNDLRKATYMSGVLDYEEFSTEKSYAVSDVVSYNNKAYKFIVPHSAGAFDEGQVEETSLKEEIVSLTDDFYKFIQKINLIEEKNGSLLEKDGKISDLNGSAIYKFDASPVSNYAIFGEITGVRAICFYDENDDYISGIANISSNNVSIVNTPKNTTCVRFCCLVYSTSAKRAAYMINTCNANQINQIIDEIKVEVENNSNTINGEYTSLNKSLTQDGYYGVEQTIGKIISGEMSENGHKSGAIDISDCNKIRIDGFITTSSRCTVITDENNIVLQYSKERDGESKEFFRHKGENWKYLYCSSQYNNVTIKLFKKIGLIDSNNDNLQNNYYITQDTENILMSEIGCFINYQNGEIQENTSYSPKAVTNIKVLPGVNINLQLNRCPISGQRGYAFYDITGKYISGGAYTVNQTIYNINVPNDAFYMGITVFKLEEQYNFSIFINSLTINRVVDCFINSVKPLAISSELFEKLTKIEFILPSQITGTIGHNTNINLDNIIPENGSREKAQAFFYENNDAIDGDVEIIPSEEGTVNNNIVYEFSVSYGSKQQLFPLIAVSNTIGNGLTKKVIVIGESTTDNNYVIKHLFDLFEDDVMNITLLGTRQDDSGNHHEGRGGWTTNNYMQDSSYKDVSNAFYNPDISSFDFSYYLSHNSIETPDIVIFNMGLNDLDIGGGSLTVTNLTTMINQIKEINNNVIIIVALPNLPTGLEQLWGYRTNRRYRLLTNTIKVLIDGFDNREDENIFIAPVYLYIHPKWDMPYTMKYVNSENNEDNNGMKIPVAISPAPTHPSQIGYYKMADCYYNAIKYAVSKQ